jgi:hypothetical protein
MNEQGLAGQGAGISPEMVQQVIAALQSGVSADELIAQGVPPEVIQLAMQELSAQAQQPVGPQGGGLAGQGLGI